MRVWLRYCLDLRYLDQSRWEHWRDEYEAIAKMQALPTVLAPIVSLRKEELA